jgi:DNA polymerase-3 subunit alpha
VITGLQKKWTRKGQLMAVLVLEDLTDSVETMVFPRTFTDYGHLLEDDRIVVVRGRLDGRDDQPKLMAQSLEVLDTDNLASAPPLRLAVNPNRLTDRLIGDLKLVLGEHQGQSPVYIHLGDQAVRLSDEFCVDTTSALMAELRVLLGAEAVAC